MKHLMFTILALTVTSQSAFAQKPQTHQNLFDTIPYIMDHHQKRLALFSKEPMTQGGTLFLGNSITEGASWDQLVGGITVNRGISGDITFGMLQRLDEVVERKPEKLFILIGINDLSKDIPPTVVADNVRKIIARIKSGSPATRIFLQSILPVNPRIEGFPHHFGKEHQVLLSNQLLYKAAAAEQVTFVNLFPYFLDKHLQMDANFSYDGVHLNEAGYTHWVSLLKEWKFL